MEKGGNQNLEAEMKDAFPPPIYRACSVFPSLHGVVGEVVTFSLIWQCSGKIGQFHPDFLRPKASSLLNHFAQLISSLNWLKIFLGRLFS